MVRSIGDSREMVTDNVFYALFVSNLEIKFLKKKDLTNESGFDILLKH